MDEHEYMKTFDLYSIDRWYDTCKDFTFPTQLLSLTKEEVHTIMEGYSRNVLRKPITDDNIYNSELQKLKEKLEHIIQQVGGSEGVFVRMSTRSPKDSGFQTDRMRTLLAEMLKHESLVEKGSGSDEDDDDDYYASMNTQNYEFFCFFTAQIQSLKITTADEALELLTRSERVFEDLESILAVVKDWNVYICVRKWLNFPISNEFRGFVYQRRLVALSQYFDVFHLPNLEQNSDVISTKVLEFFDTIKDKIPYDDCVMDFAIVPNGDVDFINMVSGKIETENSRVMCIEFNPYNRFTSGCMFQWDKDKDILFSTDKELEFRFIDRPLPVLRQSDPFDQFGMMMNNVDPTLLEEHSELLDMVEHFVTDPYERISSNFQYVLKTISSRRFYDLFEKNNRT
jgi:hypothetical protein